MGSAKVEQCPPEQSVSRVLEWWEKGDSNVLLGTEELRGITLAELKSLFVPDEASDPCLFDQYAVCEQQASRLRSAVTHSIDIAAHDYYVCAYQR